MKVAIVSIYFKFPIYKRFDHPEFYCRTGYVVLFARRYYRGNCGFNTSLATRVFLHSSIQDSVLYHCTRTRNTQLSQSPFCLDSELGTLSSAIISSLDILLILHSCTYECVPYAIVNREVENVCHVFNERNSVALPLWCWMCCVLPVDGRRYQYLHWRTRC